MATPKPKKNDGQRKSSAGVGNKRRTAGRADDLASRAAFLDRESEEERATRLLNPPPKFGFLDGRPEEELGKRIEQARRGKELTQGELAERTRQIDPDGKGISRAVVSLYELGTNKPSPREIRLLCEVLRCSPNHLIYGEEDPFDERTESARFGGYGRSEPEVFARIAYCISRLHHHQYTATMTLLMAVLRGWNDGFDQELDREADATFLRMARELEKILAKRVEQTK